MSTLMSMDVYTAYVILLESYLRHQLPYTLNTSI